ncbi:hypothetical protein TWF481_007498 [Arthrobotrys musiformis]|uniref:Uncharacterized protein n=1 Tax=Arthrobotrys musiformis TaxID=47236 RepID=A0AAV9WBN8_9PEZI
MSSTSADVCELWSGETIVRTLGSPYIAEVLWLEKIDTDDDDDESAQEVTGKSEDDNLTPLMKQGASQSTALLPEQFFGLGDAEKAGLIHEPGATSANNTGKIKTAAQLFRDHIFELGVSSDDTPLIGPSVSRTKAQGSDRESQNSAAEVLSSPPNLSLNISGDLTSTTELVLVAFISTVLQTGVIVFQLIITYLPRFNDRFLKGGNRIPSYACPLTVGGTVMVVFGMYICSMVVQEKSKEKTWSFNESFIPPGYRLRVAWLQRHQVVTDQNFGGFCLYAPPERKQIMTSIFHNHFESQNLWTFVGTAVSIVGFVTQFTGLRGMHYSATLAQLAAILIVSLLRIMIRRQLVQSGPLFLSIRQILHQIEAILTLWELSIAEDDMEPDTGYNDRSQSLILLGPSSEFNPLDFDIFVGNSSKCLQIKNGMGDLGTSRFPVAKHRVFGYMGTDEEAEHIGIMSFANISDLCARHILTCYFHKMCEFIEELNGQTTFHDVALTNTTCRMNNSHLDGMVEALSTTGIQGSREELLTILVPALQKSGNLLRIFDAFSKVIQDTHEAETNGQQPALSQEALFRMTEQAVREFRNHGHWLYCGDVVFGLLGTCQQILGESHDWTSAARSLVSRVCSSIETQINFELDFHDGSSSQALNLSETCSSLMSQCQAVLGKDSDEWSALRRLYFRAKFAVLRDQEVFELLGASDTYTITTTDPSLPADPTVNNTANIPLHISGGDSDAIHSTQALRTSQDISSIKNRLPSDIWALIKIQDLKALHSKLCPLDPSDHETLSGLHLASDTLLIAAASGYAKVVELCLRKFPDLHSYSSLGIESSISKAASFAAINNDSTMLDLIVSSLSHDQMGLLAGGSSSLNCLQIACRDGNVGIAHLLLRSGFDLSSPSYAQDFESLPIALASRRGHIEIISLLLSYSIPYIYQSPEGQKTILHHAIEHNSTKTVEFVLAPGSNLLHLLFVEDSSGRNPLHLAIIGGNKPLTMQILEAMVAQQADQNGQGSNLHDYQKPKYQHALFLACKHGHLEVVKLLISRGFSPEVVDKKHRQSPFEITITQNDCDIGEFILQTNGKLALSVLTHHFSGTSPLNLAVYSGSLEYVELLIKHGAAVDFVEHGTGNTPLLISAGIKNLDIFRLLIEQGADINAENWQKRTFMHIAAVADSAALLEFFFGIPEHLSSSHIFNKLDNDNYTALGLALMNGNFKTTAVLLGQLRRLKSDGNHLTDPLFNDEAGSSLLHMVCISLIFEVGPSGDISLKPFLDLYNRFGRRGLLLNRKFNPSVRAAGDFHISPGQDWAHREEMAIGVIEYLFKENLATGMEVGDEERLPLFYAAAAGSSEICKLILPHMDATVEKSKILDVLCVAIYGANIAVIREILNSGIDVNEPLIFGHEHPPPIYLLLHLAARTKRIKEGRFTEYPYLDEGFEKEPWDNEADVLACMKLFIDAGADLNPTPKDLEEETTLFHLAVMCRSLDMIAALVNAGADINLIPAASNNHQSLLHFAVSYRTTGRHDQQSYLRTWIQSVIPAICSYGVDINCFDARDETPLAYQVRCENIDSINALLDNGGSFDPGYPDEDLYHAFPTLPSEAVFKFLKVLCERHKKPPRTEEEYLAFLNRPMGPEKCCAVHLAAKYGERDILKFLHEQGADMHAKDGLGRNAARYAHAARDIDAYEGESTMRLLIEEWGVDPWDRDLAGYTAFNSI